MIVKEKVHVKLEKFYEEKMISIEALRYQYKRYKHTN